MAALVILDLRAAPHHDDVGLELAAQLAQKIFSFFAREVEDPHQAFNGCCLSVYLFHGIHPLPLKMASIAALIGAKSALVHCVGYPVPVLSQSIAASMLAFPLVSAMYRAYDRAHISCGSRR